MQKLKYIALGALLCSFTTAIAQSLPTKHEQLKFLRWYVQYKRLVPIVDTNISVPSKFTVTDADDIERVLTGTNQTKDGRRYIKKQTYLLNRTLTLDTETLQKLKWNKAHTNGSIISIMSPPVFSINR